MLKDIVLVCKIQTFHVTQLITSSIVIFCQEASLAKASMSFLVWELKYQAVIILSKLQTSP